MGEVFWSGVRLRQFDAMEDLGHGVSSDNGESYKEQAFHCAHRVIPPRGKRNASHSNQHTVACCSGDPEVRSYDGVYPVALSLAEGTARLSGSLQQDRVAVILEIMPLSNRESAHIHDPISGHTHTV